MLLLAEAAALAGLSVGHISIGSVLAGVRGGMGSLRGQSCGQRACRSAHAHAASSIRARGARPAALMSVRAQFQVKRRMHALTKAGGGTLEGRPTVTSN